MKFNKYLICALFLVLICCIGAASAAEADDAVAADDAIDEEVSEAVDVSDEVVDDSLGVSEEPALSDGETPNASEKVIYVGQNTTDDGGNGSYENPYGNLSLACDNVNGEETTTINIFNGTYYIGSELKFKTNNLIINGIGGEVVIKNEFDTMSSKQAIELYSSSSNCSFNNITFDGSNWTAGFSPTVCFFTSFYGDANLVEYNNCSFIGGTKMRLIGASEFNLKLINCVIRDFSSNYLFFKNLYNGANPRSTDYRYVYLENCIFLNIGSKRIAQQMVTDKNVSIEGAWFGENNIPDYLKGLNGLLPTNKRTDPLDIPIVKYAIFSAQENYLGNNTYEIIGKLCWNGTNDTVGNSFAPMIVTLTSSTGDIVNSTTLENGTFRVIYTSNSSENKVTATLDYQPIDLIFTNLDIQVDSPSVFYGDNQNITVTLPQTTNATVNITINNKTYEVKVNGSDSVTFTVPEVLKEGTYIVDVLLVDADNHIYGSNSTELVVSKVSDYTFAPIVPSDAKFGENMAIIVELPEDATGEVTVKVGNKNFTQTASANVEVNVDGLSGGDNVIIVKYSGDDKYKSKSIESIVTVEKAQIEVTNNTFITETPANEPNPTVSINLSSDATGNLTVTVNGKNFTKELVNGSATVEIKGIPAGSYNAIVTYSGDKNYLPLTQNTTVVVKEQFKPTAPTDNQQSTTKKVTKKASKIVAKKKTFKAKTKVKKYTITLKSGKKPIKKVKVTIKIGKKTFKAKTNNKGKATFKIKKLTKKGKYNAKITFKGNKLYKATSKKVKITIKK